MHFQIIIEVIFFVVIFFLLWRLKQNIEKYRPLADGTVITDLKQVMADSQASADGFIELLEENKQTLKKLARQLEEKEKMLTMLMEQAEVAAKKLDSERSKLETSLSQNSPILHFTKGVGEGVAHLDKGGFGTGSSSKRYEDFIEMARQGMSREALAAQSDFSEDEINLIMAFAKSKTGQYS